MKKKQSQTSSSKEALFLVGKKIETMKETFEQEAEKFSTMKIAFAMAMRCLEDYRATMQKELAEQSVSVKEGEYGKVYVGRCVELIKQLYIDTEGKRIKAEGGSTALNEAVDVVKQEYDRALVE